MFKTLTTALLTSAALSLALLSPVQAKVVKNAYYSLDLGTEWEEPNGDKMQNNNYSTYYTNKAHDTAIYISINEVNMSAEQIAASTAEQMRTTGAKVQEIQVKDDIHSFEYTIQEVPGKYCFKTIPNGYVAVSIFGTNVAAAEELLSKIKPYGKSVIPKL